MNSSETPHSVGSQQSVSGPSGLWLESPQWDSFWILSGLWLLLVILSAQAAGLVPKIPDALSLGALVFLWGGHILAPVIVTWMNPGLRAHMAKQPGKYLLFPTSILCISILVGMLGDLSQWTVFPEEFRIHVNPRFLIFYSFLIWNTWHFSAQHFGVLAIYRKLAKQWSPRDRGLDRAFSVVMTCVLLPVAWYTEQRWDRLGQLVVYLPDPSAWPHLTSLVIVTSAGLTLLYVLVEFLKPNASLPRALYILSIGIQPIFGTFSYPFFHMAVFSICHWMIEFALASRILRNQLRSSEGPSLGLSGAMTRNSFAKHILVLALISIPMYGLFWSQTFLGAVAQMHQSLYDEAMFFAYKLGTQPLALGAISGVYFGISFVHFLYDRHLYAFSRPEVSRSITPHLFRTVRN